MLLFLKGWIWVDEQDNKKLCLNSGEIIKLSGVLPSFAVAQNVIPRDEDNGWESVP